MMFQRPIHESMHRALSRALWAEGLMHLMGPDEQASIAIKVVEDWHNAHGCPESEAAYLRGVRAGRAGEETC